MDFEKCKTSKHLGALIRTLRGRSYGFKTSSQMGLSTFCAQLQLQEHLLFYIIIMYKKAKAKVSTLKYTYLHLSGQRSPQPSPHH